MSDAPSIAFELNGRREEVSASWCDSLADLVRDRLDLTATHIGCNEGVCGACTVLVDGKSMRSCMVLAGQVRGCRVETVEGFAETSARRILQRAFVDQFAAQCGFCTPGMLAVAAEFLEDPSVADHSDEEEIQQRLKSVLCRCTGYRNIVAAIVQAAREIEESRHG